MPNDEAEARGRSGGHAGDNVQIAGGDASILATLIVQNYAEVRAMLHEARRATDTPGVRADLNEHLADRLRGLLLVDAEVLDPAVQRLLGAAAADRTGAPRERLIGELGGLSGRLDDPVPDRFADALDQHVESLREVTLDLGARDAAAARHLSFRYMERVGLISHV
jgi:hypothetical protein